MKLLLICVFYIILNTGSLQSFDKTCNDSIYKKAFNQIRYSDCVKNKIYLCDTNIIYYLSDEVLYLLTPFEIDTNSSSFYRNKKFYIKSNTSYVNKNLQTINYVSDNVFNDSTKSIFVIFFTEIIDNYFIAEIYLYNYFPVITVNKLKDIKEDINYHKKYEDLKEFALVSRILFSINHNDSIRFYCK